jgi:hypothetical protein
MSKDIFDSDEPITEMSPSYFLWRAALMSDRPKEFIKAYQSIKVKPIPLITNNG